MKEILLETVIDNLKILPFLFITYLLMEYIEHKTNKRAKDSIKKSGKFGPLLGGIVGAFPQCGFSVSATNLYVGRVITLGTLIAVYLSTSDEMLPILISESVNIGIILQIISIKMLIGIVAGFIIDMLYNKSREFKEDKIVDICKEEHCHCEKGIFKSAIKHTISILIFILGISLVLNTIMFFIGEEYIASLILNKPILGPVIASLIGLIPNCAASVVLTELYLSEVITMATMISGLLVGAGVGLVVLFKVNKNLKENLKIVALIYLIGVFSGIVLNVLL